MIRLNLIVEGPSEETFADQILKEPLSWKGVALYPQSVITSKDKKTGKFYKGGVSRYEKIRKHLLNWMSQDNNPDAFFTTMLDLYAFPDDIPGWKECIVIQEPYKRVECVESYFAKDIDHPRFIPYIQLFEFEALLLSNPDRFDAWFLDNADDINKLKTDIAGYPTPEHVNDDPKTAPSKRIISFFPQYEWQKVAASSAVSRAIGLSKMRELCKHFDSWLVKVEGLSKLIE